MKLRYHAALGGALSLLLAACAQETGTPNDEAAAASAGALGAESVATVNGEPVPASLFRLYALNGYQKNAEELTAEEREQITQDLIELKLIEQEAEEQGLLDSRRLAAELELQRLQLIARNLLSQHIQDNPATETELRAVYEENLSQYQSDQYKARHILVETEEEAAEVIRLLDDGGDFAELAQERSTGPTGPNGGDLGYFSADSMVQPFSEAVQGMEVGSYTSEPVQTQFGWHVILLEDVREQEPPGLDAVRTEVSNMADRQKVEAFIESLREGVSISTNY